jgi:3-methyladenine DNA glycosylase AlkD
MWIRRAAIIFQLRRKEKTDEKRLFSFCLKRASEKEFFIRKAIGWALREYGKTNPESLKKFLRENGSSLSPLSLREAGRRIDLFGAGV